MLNSRSHLITLNETASSHSTLITNSSAHLKETISSELQTIKLFTLTNYVPRLQNLHR